ncbi:MAG: ribose ABC transporter [Silicimonas sp.]|nr:ribose ABC transporter [Silicimonas sp.]
MLRNINPILSPDIIHALAAMGHGDEIVIADANFPGESSGPRCLHAEGSNASDMLHAVLSLMPLDTFVPDPAITMQVVDDPDAIPDAVKDFQSVIDKAADAPAKITNLERFAFYDRAATASAVIQTGERRLYGNIILKKGVIA